MWVKIFWKIGVDMSTTCCRLVNMSTPPARKDLAVSLKGGGHMTTTTIPTADLAAYYDPEEYIVTAITIAMPVGPTATGGPHIVTITYGANSSAAESVTINAKADQVWALDKAWMELWDTAMHDDADFEAIRDALVAKCMGDPNWKEVAR